MLKLGVNIDHVATLREARYRGRGNGVPDPVEAALICAQAGAHGITAHLREDRRHIQDRDVRELRQKIRIPLNLEMANAPEIVEIALRLKPEIVCLVPERRAEVTTEGGLEVEAQVKKISSTSARMRDRRILVSLFISPDPKQVKAAAKTGCEFIELHTGAYAESFSSRSKRKIQIRRLRQAAILAHDLGIKVNAGHGLNYENVSGLSEVPHLEELNIGHSIVSRAIQVGLSQAVRDMLAAMRGYRS